MTGAGRHVDSLRAGSVVLWAATVLPPVGILALVGVLAVNIPFQDDWDMLSVVTKWHAGTLTFGDFWQQHSEHRITALKGMIWAIGAATDFDVVAGMRVGWALSVIKLGLIADLIRVSLKDHARHLIAPLALISSLLMFSLVQHEDWFWGTASLQFSLLNLCTVTLVWALSRWADSWWGLSLAGSCAVVGMFTEAAGEVLWITGGLAIHLLSRQRTGHGRRLLAWAGAACSILAAYYWNLHWARSSLAAAVFESPGRLMAYAGACLGLPFAYWLTPKWSAVVGYAGCVPLALAAWWLHTSNRQLFRKLYPFLLFAAHGVLVCILIAVGRSGGDPQSALTSHYSFAPTLYWIGVLVLTAAACSAAWAGLTPSARAIGLALVATAEVFLVFSYGKGNVEGYRQAYTRSRNLQMALATLSSESAPPRAVLRFLYSPDEQRALSLVGELRAWRLGPFSSHSTGGMALAEPFSETPAGPEADGFLDGGDCIETTGWAWDPAHPDEPVALDVWSGETLLGTVTADWFRWDLLTSGKGRGQHAFRFLFPTQSALRTGRLVNVTFAGTHRPLRGSPTAVLCRD